MNARTPLLRSIATMSKEHHRAAALGLSLAAFRARKAEAQALAKATGLRSDGKPREAASTGISRRTFLGGTAAAAVGAGLILPRSVRAAQTQSIAIIGGGIAGLAAALKFADNGVEATVYEANTRVGGRMFSNRDYFGYGQNFEWCGELIDSGHLTIKRLTERFGLQLDDLFASEPAGSDETYYFNGRYYPKHEADADFKNGLMHILKEELRLCGPYTTVFESTGYGRMLNQMSVYDWIESRVPGGHSSPLGELLDTAYYIELNSPTTEQSALNLLYLLAYQPNWNTLAMFGLSDEKYKIRGGNDQVPQRIANHLGSSRVRLGMRMESIAQTSGGRYDITFNGGAAVVRADMVLICTPFAVLRDLDYSRAGFDGQKDYAIRNLGGGRQSKQHVQFTRRVWNEPTPAGIGNGSSYSDTGYQATWEASRAQAGAGGILVGYCGGPFADAMHSKVAFSTSTGAQAARRDAEDFLRRAETVFPGLTGAWNGKSAQGLPHLDPNFKCSYSYFKIGQYETIAGYERVRQGNVFFAGEHCSFDFQGFMEGGATEGEQSALKMMAAMGVKNAR